MKSFKQIREAKSSSGYDLYHKDFSGAMQHAYAHAKKKGYVVDKDDVDHKVAMGPKRPSSGKTNKYILDTNKKQKLHIQVANLDNRRYELNMYIESVQEFKPHKMYDPKTGKEYDADTQADHDKYAKLGYTHDKPAINEALKTTHVVIDTADGNKIVSSATNEKQAKSSIVSAQRPPMNIKDKKTLKVVQLKKPVSLNKDILGTVFKESIELEEALKNVRGKDGKTYTLDFDMSGRKITVRTKNQFGDIKTISMKQAAKLFEDSILESAKRDAFRAMDKRGKDSADDDDVKATADDRKAADKNIIVQLRRVADLSKGGVIEFKNGKKVNLKQNLAKAVLMKYNTIKRNDQKLKFADLASQSPQDLQKALKLK